MRKSKKSDPHLRALQRIARALEGIEQLVDIFVFNTEEVQSNIAEYEREQAKIEKEGGSKVVSITSKQKE